MMKYHIYVKTSLPTHVGDVTTHAQCKMSDKDGCSKLPEAA